MKSILAFFQKFTLLKGFLISLTPILSMFISIKQALFGLVILMIFDLITGIKKSLHEKDIPFRFWKIDFWKSIKSNLLRRTWKKGTEYGVGIIVLVVFESMIIGETLIPIMSKEINISTLGIIVVSSIELWSIFENIESVKGVNILKKVLLFLPNSIKNFFLTKKQEK